MIQGGCSLGLVLKTAQSAHILSQSRRNRFERNLAAQLRIFGEVNLSHTAGTEKGNDFVVTQLRACRQFFFPAMGHHPVHCVPDWLVQEVHRLAGRGEQRFHFLPQFGVARTLAVKQLGARSRRQFQSFVKQALNLPPALWSGSHPRPSYNNAPRIISETSK